MWFSILGPVSVANAAGPVPLGDRMRLLLALLLVNAGETVSSARLTDVLWPDRDWAEARNALNTQLSRLRRVVNTDLSRLVARSPGYVLHADDHEFDAGRFNRLAARAAEALAVRDFAAAAGDAGQALACWRGSALDDLASEPFARARAAELEERRLATVECGNEARLALGEHRELVPALQRQVREHPLRERFWAHLMLALYRSGRQADALAAYTRLRTVLAEELGLDPSGQLATLERAILNQDPALDRRPGRPLVSGDDRTVHVVGPAAELGWRLPLPAPVAAARDTPIVGREAAIRLLDTAWATARSGHRQVVVVSGEPGIGKTRLAADLTGRVQLDGGLVLWGRCDEELGLGYQPVAEALRDAVTAAPVPVLRRWLGVHGAGLARLLPEVCERLGMEPERPTGDADLDRQQLFDAVAATLIAMAGSAPVLIVIDDLQWASQPARRLLRHLISRAAGLPLLLVATFRDTEQLGDPVLAEVTGGLYREDDVRSIQLGGLDDAGIDSLLAAAGVTVTNDADLTRLHRDPAGNPLFTVQLARHLAESTAAGDRADLPTGVRATVAQRVARLPAPAREAIVAGAVLGGEFDRSLAARVVRAPLLGVGEALDRAVSARLLQPGSGTGRYAFVHGIVRDAVYADLPPTSRADLHRRAGEALAAQDRADRGRIAHHLMLAADLVAPEQVVSAAQRAAAQAVERSSPDEAVAHLRHAIAALDRRHVAPAIMAELQISLAQALHDAGAFVASQESAMAAANHARACGRVDLLAEAALAHATYQRLGIADSTGARLLDEALAAVGEADQPRRAMILASLAYYRRMAMGQGEPAWRQAGEAIDLARASGDRRAIEYSLQTTINIGSGSPEVAELLYLSDELDDLLADRTGGVTRPQRPDRARSVIRLQRGETGALRHPAGRTAATIRGRHAAVLDQIWSGMAALSEGRLADAEAVGVVIDEYARREPNYLMSRLGQLVLIRREQGRLAELLPLLEPPCPLPSQIRSAVAVLAHLEAGRPDAAAAVYQRLAGQDFHDLTEGYDRPVALAFLSEACFRFRDERRAGTLARLLEPYRGQLLVIPWGAACLGSADRYRGMLAAARSRWDEALRLLVAAGAAEDRVGARALALRTLVVHVQVLLNEGSATARRRAADLLQADVAADLLPAVATEVARLRRLVGLPNQPAAAVAEGPSGGWPGNARVTRRLDVSPGVVGQGLGTQ